MDKTEEFIQAMREYVNYWNHQEKTKKECLEGLAFSCLVLLDGMSVNFNGSRDDLDKDVMLHDNFYKKKKVKNDKT